jgi:hypothetical protein
LIVDRFIISKFNQLTTNNNQQIKMNILDKIIERKKQEVAFSKSKISVEQLKDSEFLEEKLFL